MIKIILTDDHALVRAGLTRLFNSDEEVQIVAEAESGEECIELVTKHSPDIVILDLNMPGIGGFETCRRILNIRPDQKVIILTVSTDMNFPKRLLGMGARGYLTKECDTKEMLEAIKMVHRGGSYIEPRIAQQLALSLIDPDEENPIDKLSRREFQVMLLLSHGHNNSEISKKLCLSPKTISTYRTRLLEKLGVENEVDLVRIAVVQGMVHFIHDEEEF